MNKTATALMCACLALAAGGVSAQSTKNTSDLDKDMPTTMTIQNCKDHMAMSKKDNQGTERDKAAMAKMESDCAKIMKKDKKDMSSDPMKK